MVCTTGLVVGGVEVTAVGTVLVGAGGGDGTTGVIDTCGNTGGVLNVKSMSDGFIHAVCSWVSCSEEAPDVNNLVGCKTNEHDNPIVVIRTNRSAALTFFIAGVSLVSQDGVL